jgi:molybdopterin/thiamine biosynthesis adenylyltransferase
MPSGWSVFLLDGPKPFAMDDNQLLRYSRHILLDELGIEAQQAFLDSHVLIVGAGGLGSPAAMYLAAAGVGALMLVDNDTVDLTNLQRQILHTSAAVGQAKVASGARTLAGLNPGVRVTALQADADEPLLTARLPEVQVVLDCTDNFATRHLLNRMCVRHRVPLVSGAALRFDGQLAAFDPRRADSPCYACIFPPHERFEETSCATMGVFSPLVGVIGAMQAAEALRILAGLQPPLAGRLMLFDASTMEWTTIRVRRQADCPVCGARRDSAQPATA